MGLRQREPAEKGIFRTLSVRLTSFVLVAAAGIWLAACSGTAPPAAAPPSTPPAHVAAQGQASTPTPVSPESQQGAIPTATPGAQAGGASAGAGEVPKASSSPAAAAAAQPKVLTITDKGQGGVTVKATWVTPGSKGAAVSELDRYLAFSLALDTHSVNLSQYNLVKVSALRDDKGREISPAAWENESGDSHHREGVLKFPKGAEQGSKYLELVIREVGGVKERVLRWDLGQ